MILIHRISFFFIMFKITMASCQAAPAQNDVQRGSGKKSDSTHPDVGKLASGKELLEIIFENWKARESRIKTAHFRWEDSSTSARGLYDTPGIRKPGQSPPKDFTGKKLHELYLITDAYRYEFTGPAWSGIHRKIVDTKFAHVISPKENASLFDTFHSAQSGAGFTQRIVPDQKSADTLENLPMFLHFRPSRLRFYTFNLDGWRVSQQPNLEIDDPNVIRIESKKDDFGLNAIYIDTAKSFAVVRIEVLGSNGPKLREDISYSQKESEWYPSHWTASMYNDDRQLLIGSNTKVTQVEFNSPIDASLFHLEFPPNTVVTDVDNRTNYVINQQGKRIVEHKTNARIQDDDEVEDHGVHWIHIGVLMVLPPILLLVIFVLRARFLNTRRVQE